MALCFDGIWNWVVRLVALLFGWMDRWLIDILRFEWSTKIAIHIHLQLVKGELMEVNNFMDKRGQKRVIRIYVRTTSERCH